MSDARAPDNFENLKADVDRLGRALGKAIRAISGVPLYELEEEIRALTKAERGAPSPAQAERLEALVRGVSVGEAEGVARAFATYFHLVNLAEERHRVRVNRAREVAATAEAPRNESFRALVKALAERGHDAQSLAALLGRVSLVSTFTAHPTESRRRTVRAHLTSILQVLDGLDAGAARTEELDAFVSLLFATDELRRTRPTVQDEVRGGLEFLPTTLWEALPRVALGLEDAIEERFGVRPRLSAPVAFRSWIGGDRDGNPNVTPEVTAWAQAHAGERAVRQAIDEVDRLIGMLSASRRWVDPGEELEAQLAADAGLALPDRFEGEPYRRYLMAARAKLRARLGEREGPAYESGEAWHADLVRLADSLERAQLAAVATRVVGPARVRAASYGLELARLDLREESSEHAEAVAELLRVGGVHADYLSLAPPERAALLSRELQTPRPLAQVGYAPSTPALKVALGALAVWRARGAYVISMTRGVADVLEVFVLAREAGLYTPGRALPFDVVPLFETLGDLGHAADVVRALVGEPIVRAHVEGRGGLEVMIGYSDSNKDAGYLAASWALAVAQDAIVRVAREAGVRVSFFHGRGTSTARGGGPAGRALASLPEGSVGTRIRLTEQGEALADRYEHVELAVRHLEQLLYHFVLAADRDERGAHGEAITPERRAWLEEAEARSAQAYRGLLHTPGFFEFFEAVTPIGEIAALKIASRPVYRHGRVRDVKDLRAIPWVMSWTQVRANLPGWFGAGTGLAHLPIATRRALYAEWPLFRSLLDGAAMSLAKSDLRITAAYMRLAEPALAQRFLPMLVEEHDLTRALLEETFEAPLLHANPTLQRQVDLRNPYVDPLNHLQIELLARLRALPPEHPDRPATERALLTTLLGIAAGVRNVG